MKYQYEILNYWNDSDDLYVDYIITNKETDEKVHTCTLLNTDDINDYMSNNNVEDEIMNIINKSNGNEFKLPKVSQLSPLLRYVYDFVCESESNMCHVGVDEWEDLKEENDFTDADINILDEEIKKYGLDDYIVTNDGEYKICGYGGLQTCFNDDRDRGSDELER